MLRQLRDHSRSYILYIMFGIIISVFIINFGPQSSGCSARSNVAGKVGSKRITTNELNYSLNVSGINSLKIPEAQRAVFEGSVLDQYLVNQLLADEARKLGIRVGDDEIDDMLLEGKFLSFGRKQQFPKKGGLAFDYDYVSKFIRYNWQVTMKQFKELQRDELLTKKLIQSINSAEIVSPDEAKLAYFAQGNRRKVEYREFTAFRYGSEASVSDAAVDSALNSSDSLMKEAKDYYEENKASYALTPSSQKDSQQNQQGVDKIKEFDDVKKEIVKALLLKKKKSVLAKNAADKYLKRAIALGKLPAPPADASAAKPGDGPTTTPWFVRDVDGKVPGIGVSPEIMNAAFDGLETGVVGKQIYSVDRTRFYVIRLAEMESVDESSWAEKSKEQIQIYQQQRQMERIGKIKRLVCKDALKRNLLNVQLGTRSAYKPCASFDMNQQLSAG